MNFIRYFIFIGLILLSFNGFGQQNLIDNGSFEERDFFTFNNPTPSTLVDAYHKDLRDWTDDFQNGKHSPDWFKVQPTYIHIRDEQGNSVQAQDQLHYAGMLRGELMQQKLSSKLKKDKSYKLIFYICLMGAGFKSSLSTAPPGQLNYGHPFTDNYPEAFIDILLSDEKIKYTDANASPPCDVNSDIFESFSEKSTPFITAASIPINMQAYPKNQWHKVEVFLEQGMDINNLNWIGLELRHEQTELLQWIDPQEQEQEHCTKPYVLIDNVQLYEQTCDVCKNCSYKDGCINVDVINNISGLTCPEFINLGNVTHLKIEIIKNGTSLTIRNYNLTNPPSSFSWDLKNNKGEQQTGEFIVKIKASNDCQSVEIIKNITVPSDKTSCTNLTTISPASGDRPPDGQCCGEFLYLNNVVIEEDQVFRALRIFVGPNVIIKSGVIVEFHAQLEIDISPNFEAETGADWFAYLDVNCVNDDYGRISPISDDNIIDNEVILDKKSVSNVNKQKDKGQFDILIYPNPTTGIINIDRANTDNNTIIQVFDMSGRLLKTKILIDNVSQLNLSNYPKGTYFIKIREKNQVMTKKIIIQ